MFVVFVVMQDLNGIINISRPYFLLTVLVECSSFDDRRVVVNFGINHLPPPGLPRLALGKASVNQYFIGPNNSLHL